MIVSRYGVTTEKFVGAAVTALHRLPPHTRTTTNAVRAGMVRWLLRQVRVGAPPARAA